MKNVVFIITCILLYYQGATQEMAKVDGDAKVTGSLTLIKAVGDSTVLIGANAGLNYNGSRSVFIGANAGKYNVTGKWNTFMGYNAGLSNTIGGDNTFIGEGAGMKSTAGNSNTFVGKNAGRDNTASFNTFFGKGSGTKNTSGEYNVFVGQGASNSNTTGSSNVVIGSDAGLTNTAGNRNVYLGRNAGRNNTGSDNIFIGNAAGQNNTTGSQKLVINNNNSTPLIFGDFETDQLAIGDNTFATGHMLSVHGKVACEEVRVELQENWPDYVFKENYKLPSLDEISSFIQHAGHLPGVPPAHEVERNGLDLGEMNRILLEKIEELMLYTLQQQKEIDALKTALVESEITTLKLENR